MNVKFTKGHFHKSGNILWDDVIDKISREFRDNTHKFVVDNHSTPPTFVLHTDYYPNTIQDAYNEVDASQNVKDMHMYVSLGAYSSTFGRHKDTMDVLIVQAKGSVAYKFDDGSQYLMQEGDSIFIPEGVYHHPIVFSPRVTLSFSF